MARLIKLMDDLAEDLGLEIEVRPTGRNYRAHERDRGVEHSCGIGVYETPTRPRGFEVNLAVFRQLGADDVADELVRRVREVTGRRKTATTWPAVPCEEILEDWPASRAKLIEPYFRERALLLAKTEVGR